MRLPAAGAASAISTMLSFSVNAADLALPPPAVGQSQYGMASPLAAALLRVVAPSVYAQAPQQQRPAPQEAARSGVSHDVISRSRQFAPTQRRQSRAVSLPPLRVPDLRTLRVERLLDREAAVGVVHVVVDDQVMKLLRLARRRYQRQQQYFAQPELKRRRAAVHAGSPVFISVNEIGHDLFGAHQNSQQRSLITGKHHRFRRWQPKRFGFPIGTTAYAFACALTKASARAKTRTYLKIV